MYQCWFRLLLQLKGGLSFGTEITAETTTSSASDAKIAGKFGISNLFSSLFDASVSAEAESSRSEEGKELRRESKSHTEASIAILLYDHLKKHDGFVVAPLKIEEFSDIEPGTLVEIAGTLEKNAIDWVIDFMDAVSILSNLDPEQAHAQNGPRKKGNQKPVDKSQNSQLTYMRELMDKDRKRTPISNAVLRCSQPDGLNAVITLRTANLRDLTLSELNKNTVRVVGKVTRVIKQGETMSAFENYGFALLKPAKLREMFKIMSESDDMVSDYSDIEVAGPAVQILPLMVFV